MYRNYKFGAVLGISKILQVRNLRGDTYYLPQMYVNCNKTFKIILKTGFIVLLYIDYWFKKY